MIIEKHIPTSLNADDDVRYLTSSSALAVQNCRVAKSLNGKDMRVENIPSALLRNTNLLPAGNNMCVGSTIDEQTRRIFYANVNSNPNSNGIYCYDIDANTFYVVLLDAQVEGGLGFSATNRLNREMVVVDDFLIWTNGASSIKSIRISAGINSNLGTTTANDYVFPLAATDITLIKKPPVYTPSVAKQTDTNVNSNLTERGGFQFCYYYTYKDYTNSALSAWSDLVNYNVNINTPSTSSNPTVLNPYVDTSNSVLITIPLTEQMSNEVQMINLCVKFLDSQQVSVIKTWDKNVAADLTAIQAHLSGTTALSYVFYNNDIGVTLDSVTANNNFDNIPLSAKTLEVAKNRLFLANLLNGYTAPLTTSLTAAAYPKRVGDWNFTTPYFKMGGQYKLCVNFYDQYRRKSGIVTANAASVNVPFYPDAPYFTPYIIQWALSNAAAANEIPDWAYYYQIGITRDLQHSFFFEFYESEFVYRYVTKNGDGTFSYSTTKPSNLYAIALVVYYNGVLGGYTPYHVGEYVYNAGDQAIVNFIGANTTITADVLGVDDSNSFVANNGSYWIHLAPAPFADMPQANEIIASIYTPYTQVVNEPFYERTPVMEIENPGTPTKAYSTLSGILTGDTYCFYPGVISAGVDVSIPFLQCMSPNTYKWTNWNMNLGWTNIIDTIGQQKNASNIVYSDTFIAGTKTNGLNKFEATSTASISRRSGDIQSLWLVNKIAQDLGSVMLCICENEPLSIYLEETQLVSQTQNAFVAQSNNVIGTINELRGNFGTLNPESIIGYLGAAYWFDLQHGCWVQYSTNGTVNINDKIDTYFKKLSVRYFAQKSNSLIISCIDPVRGHVFVCMPATESADYPYSLPSYDGIPAYATTNKSQFQLYDGQAKILVYDMTDNVWKYTMGAVPEWMDYIGNSVFAFLNGQLYEVEGDPDSFNNFFGTQLPARIAIVANADKDNLKDLYNLSVEGNFAPDYAVAYADYPHEQISDLTKSDVDVGGKPIWHNINGIQYAPFFKDRLSPNVAGTPEQKMFAGDYIRSVTPMLMLEFQRYAEKLKINFINIGYEPVTGHTLNQTK